ncbi:hypothetical protein [Xenorhabdus cabanillasii]|uniref:hypothetical protein n=1 Tax=Xenorhabdus cabanillasii TaxID=351673 RepID=UPI000C04FDFB|nr:hypothetical protein [Xenorhabdus cabanillasii]PHM78657.1 3-methyladenine DNA glycosylase 2 [Xenorhabdus cabanillasii JM26]
MKPSYFMEIILPDNYHTRDFLAFHHRDEKGVSEIVQQGQVKKGIIWHGIPALLTVSMEEKLAKVQLDIDGDSTLHSKNSSSLLASHMLGLLQPVEIFESQYQKDGHASND